MGRYLEGIKYVEWNAKVFFYITDGSDLLSSLIWKILVTVDVLTRPSPCRISRPLCAGLSWVPVCIHELCSDGAWTITYLHREKLSFQQKSWIWAHTSLSLHRSLFIQMQQNIKWLQKCQHSCSFGVGLGERMGFFPGEGVEWLLQSHLGEMKDP